MAGPVLSAETLKRLEILFKEEDRPVAAQLLEDECGNNLPFLEELDAHRLERFRFAALKLSGGDLDKLREAIKMAKVDWRDLLMMAGFGHSLTEHERWWPQKI